MPCWVTPMVHLAQNPVSMEKCTDKMGEDALFHCLHKTINEAFFSHLLKISTQAHLAEYPLGQVLAQKSVGLHRL